MIDAYAEPRMRSRPGEPAWDVALLFPRQGTWSEGEYLALDAGRLVEFDDGCIEVLPMPTLLHQLIVQFLFRAFDDWVRERRLGTVVLAPFPVFLGERKYREPDIVFLRPERIVSHRQPPRGADLVVEVMSEGDENRERDSVHKRSDYAAAGIPEYWIVDPQTRTIAVLTLDAGDYHEHGVFGPGMTATSNLLAGFSVPVDDVFREAVSEASRGPT